MTNTTTFEKENMAFVWGCGLQHGIRFGAVLPVMTPVPKTVAPFLVAFFLF